MRDSYAERKKLGTPRIDSRKRIVEVTMPNGTFRLAKQVGSRAEEASRVRYIYAAALLSKSRMLA